VSAWRGSRLAEVQARRSRKQADSRPETPPRSEFSDSLHTVQIDEVDGKSHAEGMHGQDREDPQSSPDKKMLAPEQSLIACWSAVGDFHAGWQDRAACEIEYLEANIRCSLASSEAISHLRNDPANNSSGCLRPIRMRGAAGCRVGQPANICGADADSRMRRVWSSKLLRTPPVDLRSPTASSAFIFNPPTPRAMWRVREPACYRMSCHPGYSCIRS